MAFRSFSMREKETEVKYMPRVGDRVQALTRGANYHNGELGSVVFVDRSRVSITTSRGVISVSLDVFSSDFRVIHH